MNLVADVTTHFPFFPPEADPVQSAAQSPQIADAPGFCEASAEECDVRLPLLAAREWPREALVVMSALDAGRAGTAERRSALRRLFRVTATLRLYTDNGQAARVLYTRDANPRGMGFISREWLQVGGGGKVEFEGADGASVVVSCSVIRCRLAAPGWYEGSIHFARDQKQFAK